MNPSYIDNEALVQFLDKVDDTAPHLCQTCKLSQRHSRQCENCLYDGPEERETALVKSGKYFYHNWVPGNSLRELDRAQKAGEQCIVIGGQGEADFHATNSSKGVVKHLRLVAEECGYCCGPRRTVYNPRSKAEEFQLRIGTHDGEFTVAWDKKTDKLLRIDQLVEGVGEVQTWPLLEKAPGAAPEVR